MAIHQSIHLACSQPASTRCSWSIRKVPRFVHRSQIREGHNDFQWTCSSLASLQKHSTSLTFDSDHTCLHCSLQFRTILVDDVPPYTVHILWQTIQYVVLTIAEVLVSLTGLIFAYSQAPKRYKVVIMSALLLTSALGDLLVVVIAKAHLVPNQVHEQPMPSPSDSPLACRRWNFSSSPV